MARDVGDGVYYCRCFMPNLSEIYKKVTRGTGTVAELVSLVAQVCRLTTGTGTEPLGHILSHSPCHPGFFCACLPFYLLYRFSTLRQDADLSKVQFTDNS